MQLVLAFSTALDTTAATVNRTLKQVSETPSAAYEIAHHRIAEPRSATMDDRPEIPAPSWGCQRQVEVDPHIFRHGPSGSGQEVKTH
ncbi:hypothetical protein [Actinoplanes sp. GCM10030250]|uniref:hypothetical protein n=1 Tax=Actinoplanes sp. GCM10030250 TaxID=3273376 RepID=UPI003611D410